MKRGETMKAITYTRVSTVGQVQDGVSLEMQQAKLRAWAALHDAELVAECSDEGLSGATAARPGLQAAIDLAVRHKAALVVYSLSRLSRSVRDTLTIAEQLRKAGADLVSLSEKIDTTSAAGEMVFTMLAALNQFERRQIGERTSAAMQHMKSQGQRVGSIPHGYQLDDGRVIPHNAEQKVLTMVRELRGQGLSLAAISAELAQRGAFNRAGRPFNPKSVRSMLAA